MSPADLLDLFAGVGGWDLPAVDLGYRPLGVEVDPAPIATRKAAGLRTLEADVSALDPAGFTGVDVLVGSPPCPDFSKSNRRNALGFEGPGGRLILEPLRYARTIRPRAIALEQVPDVLPYWQRFAEELTRVGYQATAAVLNAADYGDPQARRRAVLVARLDAGPLLPAPTHAERLDAGGLFADDRLPWVTMAAALEDLAPFSVRLEATSPYVEADLPDWCHERPATTVTSAGRVPRPGYRQHGERQFGAETVRLTIELAARLQGFPDGYPWQAPAVHRQIGNAIPTGLAGAILRTLAAADR
jgi:DNA (cytosine-5)-methyltransferase 1